MPRFPLRFKTQRLLKRRTHLGANKTLHSDCLTVVPMNNTLFYLFRQISWRFVEVGRTSSSKWWFRVCQQRTRILALARRCWAALQLYILNNKITIVRCQRSEEQT